MGKGTQMRSSSTLASCSCGRDTTMSLRRLFPCMVALTVKNLFLTSRWNQLVPIAPCLLQVSPCEERASILFVATLEVLENSDAVLPEILQGEKTPSADRINFQTDDENVFSYRYFLLHGSQNPSMVLLFLFILQRFCITISDCLERL